MANQYAKGGSSSSNVSVDNSESMVNLSIKTLDSQLFNFKVDKKMSVSAFKEKIANEIGVPVGQQRLIFRGRVLKDDHPLSEYHVENGHTLHLVERQPVQSQPSSDSSSGATHGNDSRGNDPRTEVPHNRVGHVSHSVLLGTFNVGDQGEGAVPDLNRVIGAVLNSLGINGQTAGSPPGGSTPSSTSSTMPEQLNARGQSPQGIPVDAIPGAGRHGLPGNQAQFQFGQRMPDALNTLSEFMMRMEQALQQIGNQSNAASTRTEEMPRLELPSNGGGPSSPMSLNTLLLHAHRLLSGSTSSALSHVAERLEQDGNSADLAVRGQIQTESGTLGLAMQHLGSLFLELGRTILTLHMGRSPAEFSVNTGPAIYISPSGPNPLMVQPFPLQTNSLFGGSATPANLLNIGSLGLGSTPRNVNIHIHAGTPLAPVHAVGTRPSNGEGMQGGNAPGSGGLGPMRIRSRNVIATAIPSRSAGVPASSLPQPGLAASLTQQAPTTVSLSSVLAEVDPGFRNYVGSWQGENQAPSANNVVNEHSTSAVAVSQSEETCSSFPDTVSDVVNFKQGEPGNLLKADSSSSCSSINPVGISDDRPENASSSSEKHDLPEDAKAAPLGLGLGGLDLKRRNKQPKLVKPSNDERSNSPHQGDNTSSTTSAPLSTGLERIMENRPPAGQDSDDQLDTASLVNQVLDSPAIGGLLSGVSEQIGIGSPDVLRNMFQQLTQSPQIMNTINQIAQQVHSNQDNGSMFSGLGGGEGGGGFDLSRMMQQMMPAVSRALGGGSTELQPFPNIEVEQQQETNKAHSSGSDESVSRQAQVNVQEVAQMVEDSSTPLDIFCALLDNAARLYGEGTGSDDVVNELYSSGDLATEYMEMLRRDLNRRLEGGGGGDSGC